MRRRWYRTVHHFVFSSALDRLASRTNTGGMTAIDGAWCNDNPLSCGTIQRALERAPGLVFINGAFRHRWTLVPPSPPPVPFPPPGLDYGRSSPPGPSPPPISPPPYYLGSKTAESRTLFVCVWTSRAFSRCAQRLNAFGCPQAKTAYRFLRWHPRDLTRGAKLQQTRTARSERHVFTSSEY